jgi:hypothetical protein
LPTDKYLTSMDPLASVKPRTERPMTLTSTTSVKPVLSRTSSADNSLRPITRHSAAYSSQYDKQRVQPVPYRQSSGSQTAKSAHPPESQGNLGKASSKQKHTASSSSSQPSRKRLRDEEDNEDESAPILNSDSETMADVIIERRAAGRKGRSNAVPGEKNKNMRLAKNGVGGALVYSKLMTLVCAELVRRRYCPPFFPPPADQ